MSEVVSDVGTSQSALDLLDAAARSLQCNNQRWFGNHTHTGAPADEGRMPDAVRETAVAWWAMLLASLSDAGVARAFRAMNGDAWGALDLSSDEQVMIVAVPVAFTYGVSLRELAIALWERSPGWSGDPALLSQVGCIGLADVGKTPTNATQVQWWQLARNAIALGSAMKTGAAPALGPYDPSKPATAKPLPTSSSSSMGTGTKVAIAGGLIALLVAIAVIL